MNDARKTTPVSALPLTTPAPFGTAGIAGTPEQSVLTALTDRHIAALSGRGLDIELMVKLGVGASPKLGGDAIGIPYLDGEAQPHVTMCGRDSVQIHERTRVLDLALLRNRLSPTVSDVRHNEFLLRFRVPPYEMTVFSDGRAILKGTKDPAVARSLYARYIGA